MMTERLEAVLSSMKTSAIAVSGGVDSMTLAVFANRLLGRDRVTMMHAVSPAVPSEATERVHWWAHREGWTLSVLDAREFSSEDYVSNPVNRCFFCKKSLYGTMSGLTDRQILSGTNLDDLGEYRPGLDAARDHAVRHPYLEAGIDKSGVRALARTLDLGDIAELPASPCLSSRIETSIAIDPEMLNAVHEIELLVGRELSPETVRCRVRANAVVIELDPGSFARVTSDPRPSLSRAIVELLPAVLRHRAISFAPYRNGSAFIGVKQ